MDPADKELMDQLAKGPFKRDGFDQRLRQRIVEEIGRQTSGRRRRRRIAAAWQWPVAAVASFAVILLAVWIWNGQQAPRLQDQASPAVASNPASVAPIDQLPVDPAKKYALLIGLRKDDTSQAVPAGSYRTLLVADEERPANLKLIADMPGLYMPYGQNFWQIVDTESADHRHALQAVQVTGRGAAQNGKDSAARIPTYLLSERVSYAGNEYLSIQSSVKDASGKATERWLIKHIAQMNVKPDDPAAEPYTKLQEVLPEAGYDLGQSSQWSIYRNPGQWVSELYDPATGAGRMIEGLPDNVIRNDKLMMAWPDIEKIEPNARDAFTYGNVLGVVTDKEVVVRSMPSGSAASEPVRVPLTGGESVVMIQWAQNDKIDYVDKWIQDFRGLLGDDQLLAEGKK